MDLAGMKRWELQVLCVEHGLTARGSKADHATSLAGALSVRTHTRNRAPLEKKNSLHSRGVWSTAAWCSRNCSTDRPAYSSGAVCTV
jgi:hypothetical protein